MFIVKTYVRGKFSVPGHGTPILWLNGSHGTELKTTFPVVLFGDAVMVIVLLLLSAAACVSCIYCEVPLQFFLTLCHFNQCIDDNDDDADGSWMLANDTIVSSDSMYLCGGAWLQPHGIGPTTDTAVESSNQVKVLWRISYTLMPLSTSNVAAGCEGTVVYRSIGWTKAHCQLSRSKKLF